VRTAEHGVSSSQRRPSPSAGGTRIDQRSRFQGSSPFILAGTELFGALERQEEVWREVHAHFFTALSGQ
jgi:hypothetical protein